MESEAKPVKEEPDLDLGVKLDPGTTTESDEFSPCGFMAIEISSDSSSLEVDPMPSIAIDPNDQTTMSKKHRREVLRGIEKLNTHDSLLRSTLGLRSNLSSQDYTSIAPSVAVVTSCPLLFQENFETYDVGKNAEYLDPLESGQVWQGLFEGYDTIVVAIEYDDNNDTLNHKNLLHELEMFCESSGSRYLHLDCAMTSRWEDHTMPQTPYINDVGLAFTTNSESLRESFEGWWTDKTMDEVLSWDFVSWLENWATDTATDDQMSVAFPASIHEEQVEPSETLDGLIDDQDRATIGPAEEMIEEDTLLDNMEVPWVARGRASSQGQMEGTSPRCQDCRSQIAQSVRPRTQVSDGEPAQGCKGAKGVH